MTCSATSQMEGALQGQTLMINDQRRIIDACYPKITALGKRSKVFRVSASKVHPKIQFPRANYKLHVTDSNNQQFYYINKS